VPYPNTNPGTNSNTMMKYADSEVLAAPTGIGMLAERATVKQRLTRQQKELERQLHTVNDALEAMEDQPKVADMLEKVMLAL
jgi:hypothetical protein